MRQTTCATPSIVTGIAVVSALCLPAAAIAAQFDYYIKLPPIEGDSGEGASHGGEFEIQSYSWGATQTGSAVGHGLGHGAGKVAISDSASSTYSQVKGEKGGTEDINIGVGELQHASEAEITLEGSAARKLPGKRTPPTVTLKRGAAVEDAAAGDLDGDGRATTPHFNPQELSIKKSVPWNAKAKPAPSGSVTVRGKFPSCTVGTRYPSLELGARAERFKLHNAVVTSCGGSDSGVQPMEEISFNYAKIEF